MALMLVLCCLVFAPAPLPQRHREPELCLEGTWDELGGSAWQVVTFWPGGRYQSYYGRCPDYYRRVGWWTLEGRRLTITCWMEGEDRVETTVTWSVKLSHDLSGEKEWPDKTVAGVYRLCKPVRR